MTQEELLSVAAIVERLVKRFEEQGAEYERKMAEHRDSFGARTEADRLIIEGLRAAQRVVKERDGLLAQVQDQRAEIERLRNDGRKAYQDGDALRVERDSLREEVASLKHEVDTLSCPYVSGQRVRVKSEGGLITQQSEYGIGKIGIINAFAFVARIGSRGWVDVQDIEPCDPPVDHDTPAGKEAAKAVIRDSQMTEIKAGTKLRLCKVPMPDPQLSGLVDFPWNAEWGSVGDVAEVINTLNPASLPAVAVRLESELVVWWPRSCIEIVRKVPQ